MASNNRTINLDAFSGVDNTHRAEELLPDKDGVWPLDAATNVDITDAGKPVRRQGYALATTGAFHSLWSHDRQQFSVKDGVLVALGDDLTATELQTGVSKTAPMSYVPVAGSVYYMNGEITGVVRDGVSYKLGVPLPTGRPECTVVTGMLPAGEYQLVLTARSATGEESGASPRARVALAPGGAVQVALPAALAGQTEFSVYCTEPNGDVLYEAARGAPGDTVALINTASFGAPLQTEGHEPMPAGTIVRFYKGRLLAAVGNMLVYSEPLAYGRTQLASNFFLYPEEITLVQPVENGVFVGADKTYFLAGADMANMAQSTVADARPVAGTGVTLHPGDLADVQRQTAAWFSDRGVFIGYPEGAVKLLTEDRLSVPIGSEGTMQIVKQRGIIQLMGLLKEPSDSTNAFGVTDRVTATVVRNGVTI